MDVLPEFRERGFIGPFPLFEPGECRRLLRTLDQAPSPRTWFKGRAATSPAWLWAATRPALLDRVAAALGDDVMLWGATLVRRDAGQVHPWHTDIETSADLEGTATVWIGLENVDRRSALQLVPGSHRFGMTIQERAARAGRGRDDVMAGDVAGWALELDPASGVVQPEMGDGDALLFDGRLWHGSDNTNRRGTRTALLLQYAVPHRPIRIPDPTRLEWPFRLLDDPRPPCVMVRGSASTDDNRIVPAPSDGADPATGGWARALDRPLEGDDRTGWRPHPIHAGPTPCLDRMTCHASVLSPGRSPHEPHAHAEEEVLIVLDGEAELVIVDGEGETRVETAAAGTVAWYPAWQRHTIRNASPRPVTYLMFKWINREPLDGDERLPTEVLALEPPTADPAGRGWTTRLVLDGPTRYLRKLHLHLSTVTPGGGYEPHVDAHDVGIVVLDGAIETLGRRLEPHGVAFCPAGESHGLRSVGEDPARYLVVEFHREFRHPPPPSLARRILGRVPRPAKALVPVGIKRRIVRRLR